MFILKRQDVEIMNVQHPQYQDQQIPILQYQGQTFRLLNVFGNNRDEALAMWRDLTDNKGKACVLLEEPQRFSVWGKVKIERTGTEAPTSRGGPVGLVKGVILILQSVVAEVEDFLGARQSTLFRQDLHKLMQQARLVSSDPVSFQEVLQLDPVSSIQIPAWDEARMNFLLGELHGLATKYFRNTGFVETALEVLQDLEPQEQSEVLQWLRSIPKGKLWQ